MSKRGLDGVVCGHIHHAEIRRIEGRRLPQLRRLGRILHGADRTLGRQHPVYRLAGSRRGWRRRPRRSSRRHEAIDRQRRLVTASQRVVTSLLAPAARAGTAGPPGTGAVARRLPLPALSQLSGNPLAWNLWRLGGLIEAFAPMPCTWPPRGRSAGPRGGWAKRGLDSPRRSIRVFPNTCVTAVRGCRCPGAMPSCAPSIGRAGRCWWSTPRLRDEFCAWRFQHLRLWRKGVDTELFHPAETPAAEERPPVFLYVGRLATEKKNLEAFLDLELPGEKMAGGRRPAAGGAGQRYPQARFLGYRHGRALADAYRAASVLVFPSLTDTYGLVMLEALACGGAGGGLRRAGAAGCIAAGRDRGHARGSWRSLPPGAGAGSPGLRALGAGAVLAGFGGGVPGAAGERPADCAGMARRTAGGARRTQRMTLSRRRSAACCRPG